MKKKLLPPPLTVEKKTEKGKEKNVAIKNCV